MRDWFRSSAAHNTLTVDRQSSSISAGPFSWKTITNCERLAWKEDARFTFVSGRHRGYEHGVHTRSILFLKHDYWVIRDRVELAGKHQIDLWFHFESGTSPELRENETAQFVHENGLKIASFAPGGRWTTEEGWVSHCYGERVAAPVCVFSAAAEGAFEIVTFLLPAGEEREVVEVEVSAGRGFEVRSEHSRDLLIVKGVEYTWQRTRASGEALKEKLLLSTDYAEYTDSI
jgi:hypothetical protein